MRQRSRSERGQAFALMIIALIALLGTAALVMDVGFAWYAKRQVQASADAAALAGAQELPDSRGATTIANDYATMNTPDNLNNFAPNVVTRCSVVAHTAGWCGPGKAYQANTIAVTETASTPTWFAKVFGIEQIRRQGRRDGLSAVLVVARRHHARDRPHRVDVRADRPGRRRAPT